MSIGNKIKALRKENNMTQDDLGKALFVTRNAISKWETNKGTPSIENIESLAKTFNVSIDELMNEKQSLSMIENHGLFVFIVTIISLIIYSLLFTTISLILFIIIQLFIYAISTITVIIIINNQLQYNHRLYKLFKPVLISLVIQVVLALILEL